MHYCDSIAFPRFGSSRLVSSLENGEGKDRDKWSAAIVPVSATFLYFISTSSLIRFVASIQNVCGLVLSQQKRYWKSRNLCVSPYFCRRYRLLLLLVPSPTAHFSQIGRMVSLVRRALTPNQSRILLKVNLLWLSRKTYSFWGHRCAPLFLRNLSVLRVRLRTVKELKMGLSYRCGTILCNGPRVFVTWS